MQALNALLFPIQPSKQEEGQTAIQTAFIRSGCVTALVEAIQSVPQQASLGGRSSLWLTSNLRADYHVFLPEKQ